MAGVTPLHYKQAFIDKGKNYMAGDITSWPVTHIDGSWPVTHIDGSWPVTHIDGWRLHYNVQGVRPSYSIYLTFTS